MYTVESLELALRGLYHFGIVEGDGQQALADETTEMDALLEELDFDALLQTVRHNAQTPFCYMTCGKAAKSYAYRSEELFDQRATLLYRDVTAVDDGPVSVARSTELWLLEDMTLETVSCVSMVYGSYASEYREIKGEIWETGVWVDLEDLTAKLNELCGPCFAGEIPNYEL